MMSVNIKTAKNALSIPEAKAATVALMSPIVEGNENGVSAINPFTHPSVQKLKGYAMQKIYELVMRPLVQRLGTLLGSSLATFGLSVSDVATVEAAFIIVAGLATDLLTRRMF